MDKGHHADEHAGEVQDRNGEGHDVVGEDDREADVPAVLVPSLNINRGLLARQLRLAACLNKSTVTFLVGASGGEEVAPDAEVDYFQDNVEDEGGGQLGDDDPHVPVDFVVGEPDCHLNFNIISNIVTTFIIIPVVIPMPNLCVFISLIKLFPNVSNIHHIDTHSPRHHLFNVWIALTLTILYNLYLFPKFHSMSTPPS